MVSQVRAPTFIENGEHHFNPPVKVAWHQICTAEKRLLVSTIPEIEDAAVLEKAPQDTRDPDVFRQPLDAGSQAAHASNKEVDRDPRI